MTGSPALRDLLRGASADQQTVFAICGLLGWGQSDVEIAHTLLVGLPLVRAYRMLVVQRAGRPEVLEALLPDREARRVGKREAVALALARLEDEAGAVCRRRD